MAKQEGKGGGAAGKKKKKNVVVEAYGQAHIRATFNNLIISLTNNKGEVISWSSSGKQGFRGSKKNTPYAGQLSAEEAAREAHDLGLRKVKVFVKGPGAGRESALRAMQIAGLRVTLVRDVTPVPHNGCRPPKRRRV